MFTQIFHEVIHKPLNFSKEIKKKILSKPFIGFLFVFVVKLGKLSKSCKKNLKGSRLMGYLMN